MAYSQMDLFKFQNKYGKEKKCSNIIVNIVGLSARTWEYVPKLTWSRLIWVLAGPKIHLELCDRTAYYVHMW